MHIALVAEPNESYILEVDRVPYSRPLFVSHKILSSKIIFFTNFFKVFYYSIVSKTSLDGGSVFLCRAAGQVYMTSQFLVSYNSNNLVKRDKHDIRDIHYICMFLFLDIETLIGTI